MSLAIIYSRAHNGMQSPLVTVEAHISSGLPKFTIVGLPEAAVRESKDRVRSAIINSQFDFPMRRITVNLAPADLPKTGGRFDLAIALGILVASRQLPNTTIAEYEFAAELALSGQLRATTGILPIALATQQQKRALIIAPGNASEASLVDNITIHTASHLTDVCAHICGHKTLPLYSASKENIEQNTITDLADIHGQHHAKRALTIAAAGAHSMLLTGPPGSGKTMLAKRLPGILPPLNKMQSIETAIIRSLAHYKNDLASWRLPPIRMPHHTASSVALVGGGNPPQPGEISLAHNGVLFLDELTEFKRHVLECLREPLESGLITISRAAKQAEFPARFQLIAAMNPCPCGYLGDKSKPCHCTPEQIKRYRAKISGPLLDRIDLHISMPRVATEQLMQANSNAISSSQIRERIIRCREKQLARYACLNASTSNAAVKKHCAISRADTLFLSEAIERLQLSARSLYRFIKVARTIADLADENTIHREHLMEALSYRPQ